MCKGNSWCRKGSKFKLKFKTGGGTEGQVHAAEVGSKTKANPAVLRAKADPAVQGARVELKTPTAE